MRTLALRSDRSLPGPEAVAALVRARFGPRRSPTHPGTFLETRYLKPLRISQSDLAIALGVSRRRVNELVRGHRNVTPDTALRLAALFGTEPAFWIGMQAEWDVHQALADFQTSTRQPRMQGVALEPDRKPS